MFVVGLLGWWYTDGWKQRLVATRARISSTYDYFSIDLLLGSLFSPFRQISAGQVGGSIGIKWQAFIDRTVSRVIGAVMRLFLVIFGVITILLISVLGVLSVVFWALVPVLPLIGALMMFIGWTPSWI